MTVASAMPLPERTVSVSGQLAGGAGVVNGDVNPQTGALTSFGASSAFALDSGLNSIGTDLGSVTAFNTIELRASNGPADWRRAICLCTSARITAAIPK
ncbi:hypothetical protein [Paenibacillus oceani]|uniref:Uncharacterized protein n=1 Tax=Paenibacillus oceani TaxID=2772510 RepID=A0A927H1T7_9BACL|nr:hypothetical protein [Paenibacillus oceani]MBD2865115.1 hypothetical protein [Paenibacillus oceani]